MVSSDDLALLFTETPGVGREREPSRLFRRRFGDDVDRGENATAAIESRGGSTNNFGLLDQVHVNRKVVAEEEHEGENVIGHVVAVDHDHQVAGVVARQIEASHSHGGIGPVITHVESAHRRRRFPECAVTILANILCGDDGHAGRRIFERLGMERRAHNLNLHQLFKSKRVQILPGRIDTGRIDVSRIDVDRINVGWIAGLRVVGPARQSEQQRSAEQDQAAHNSAHRPAARKP